MRLGLAALISVFLFGCGGTDAGIFDDKGDGASTDETSTAEDTGGTTTDSSMTPDGDEDTGGTVSDGDPPPPVDTGAPGKDTGVLPDTAPPPLDMGTVVPCTEPGGKMFGGHCYFPTMMRSWQNNRDVCATLKAHLVTITSDGEQAFVYSNIGTGERWIGLYRPEGAAFDKSSYKWLTPEAVSYSNWATGEPNFSGSCVRLADGGAWADLACSQNLSAICERE